nr:vegetative cell wall protein gp1-like [Aegilops tauschii subsp. strangulata]
MASSARSRRDGILTREGQHRHPQRGGDGSARPRGCSTPCKQRQQPHAAPPWLDAVPEAATQSRAGRGSLGRGLHDGILLLLVVAAPPLCAAQSPISQPPSPGAPTASPLLRPDANGSASPSISPSAGSPDKDKAPAASPPVPTETSPLPSPAVAPSYAHSPSPSRPCTPPPRPPLPCC